jgi:DNA-binding CsgD family transcriptional regulator
MVHVGREKERALASEHLRRARAGAPRPLLIAGEPGTGKSTLLAQVVADARAGGFRSIHVRADRVDAGVPYAALRLALEDQFGDDGPCELARLLERSMATGAYPAPSEVSSQLRLAMADWAFRGPVLLAIDDLHLADSGTSAAVLFLMRHLRRERVAIVATSRMERYELDVAVADGLTRFRTSDSLSVIELTALDSSELAALVVACCGAPPDGRLLDSLTHRTGGNPFFAVELLRAMTADGLLTTEQGLLHLDASQEPSLPGTISATVVHRLSLLDPDAVQLAVAAAIVGRVPLRRLGMLAQLAGVERSRAAKAFDALVAARVLVQSLDGFRFAQPIVREALYGTAGPVRLAIAHGKAVAELCAAMARGEHVDALELAHHARRAEALRPPDAVSIFERAGDALVTSAPKDAAEWYRAALGHAGTGDDVARLSLLRARALGACGATEDAVHAALGAAAAGATDHVAAEAAEVAAYALVGAGRFEDAAELLDDRLGDIAADHTPADVMGRLLVARAVVATWQGSPAVAAAHLAQAGRWARDEARPVAEAISAHAGHATGRFREARAFADRARAHAASLPVDTRAAARVALLAGDALIGDPRCALQLAECVHAGAPPTAWSNALVAWASFRLGRWDAACSAAESAIVTAPVAAAPAVAALAMIRAERSDFAGASSLLRLPTSDGAAGVTIALAAARLHRMAGDAERSVRVLLDACHAARAADRKDTLSLLLAELAEAALAARGDDLALASADELEHMSVDGGVAPAVGALLTSALVHRDAVAAAEAHGLASSYEMQPEAARARSIYGTVCDDADALIEAFDAYGAMGAVVRQRDVRRDLRRLGRRPPRQQRSGALTGAELDIANLVARGRTNREIAEACCLSPKTVEVYLSRIFIKAGCRSRVELAVLVNAGAFAGTPPADGTLKPRPSLRA